MDLLPNLGDKEWLMQKIVSGARWLTEWRGMAVMVGKSMVNGGLYL